jgi:hypothetical protein
MQHILKNSTEQGKILILQLDAISSGGNLRWLPEERAKPG